jgi:hypothetical protein
MGHTVLAKLGRVLEFSSLSQSSIVVFWTVTYFILTVHVQKHLVSTSVILARLGTSSFDRYSPVSIENERMWSDVWSEWQKTASRRTIIVSMAVALVVTVLVVSVQVDTRQLWQDHVASCRLRVLSDPN